MVSDNFNYIPYLNIKTGNRKQLHATKFNIGVTLDLTTCKKTNRNILFYLISSAFLLWNSRKYILVILLTNNVLDRFSLPYSLVYLGEMNL